MRWDIPPSPLVGVEVSTGVFALPTKAIYRKPELDRPPAISEALRSPMSHNCTLIRDPESFDPSRLREEECAPGYVPKECGRPARRGMFAGGQAVDEYVCEGCFEDMLASLPTEEARKSLVEIWHVLS